MPSDADADRPLLNLSQTARRCKLSRRQIRNAIASGDLHPVFIGTRPWITPADCDQWLRQLNIGPGSWCRDAGAFA